MLMVKEVLIVFSVVLIRQSVHSQANELSSLFESFNKEILSISHQTAELAWETNFDPQNSIKSTEAEEFSNAKREWSLIKCGEIKKHELRFNQQQRRAFNILCSGMKFTRYQQKKYYDLSNEIEKVFTSTLICVPKKLDICQEPENLWNFTFIRSEGDVDQLMFDENFVLQPVKVNVDEIKCFTGEPDLEKLMTNDFAEISSDIGKCTQNKERINYWIWEAWRAAVGPKIKKIYPDLINLMNDGARKDNFNDVGDIWKREMETNVDVEVLMKRLMSEVQPLYNMLHAFLRSTFKLSSRENLPAHILGWNANWYHLFKDVVEPNFFKTSSNMDEALKKADWDPSQVLKRVEDFYTSMGLKRMTNTFWNKSLIGDSNVSCHGTAADMFATDDFRMIVCGCKNLYDFYVMIHEIGHIEQYMLAQNLPAIFRAGNSVIQETIGDAFFLAMMTPMHLNRLRLIDDEKLFPSDKNDFDLHQLMMMAFMKLPEIPFGFVFETFRYDTFAERVSVEDWNDYFWELTRKYQRVEPPNSNTNRHHLFDPAAKFHLAANVPYARYFLANILQYQVYRGLCEKTFFGRLNSNQSLPLPLHKCDIYGSKRAGSLLRKALQPGSSANLQSTLKALTGSDEITTDAMMEYYKPLENWLKKYLDTNKISY